MIFCGGVATLITFVTVILSVLAARNYSAFLFLGSPFISGLLVVFLYGLKYRTSFFMALTLSVLPTFFTGMMLLAVAFEGLLCLLMALPIAFILAVIGGLMGFALNKMIHPTKKIKKTQFYAVALVLPLLLLLEKQPLFVQPISTSITINASPSAVWPHILEFPRIPEPTSWWFHAGIAHPKGAVIKGTGVGAVRYCNFTTGPFVEPITAWEPPHRLAFDVAKQPPSMKEMSPWPNIHPPHLDGYFQSKRGEFRLIPLANGGTKVVGTTWYVMNIWPHAYWHLWSDMLLHAIHYEVLNHIKTQVESHKSTPSPTPKS